MKRYFDINYNGEPYDAVTRRKGADLWYIGSGNKPQVGKSTTKVSAPKKAYKPSGPSLGVKKSAGAGGIGGAKPSAAQGQRIGELEGEVAEMKLTSDTLEKERDFYFGKLRDIEILLQNYQDQDIPTVDMVMKILYATEDEKVEIDENGALTINNPNGDPIEDVAPEDEDLVDNEGDQPME